MEKHQTNPRFHRPGVRTASLWLQCLLYIGAGVNHFVNPRIYLKIMPSYIPAHQFLISATGVIEVGLGVMLAFQPTRKLAACCIIAMLLAFIPAHIEMIRISGCSLGELCTRAIIAWLRLFPGQPLLILWAWYQRR